MLKDFDTGKLDKLIKEKFPIIYEYDFGGIVFLVGGAIRNTIMGTEIKDLDFNILSQKEDRIKDFIKKYNLSYRINAFGGYKIRYNGFDIDIHTTDDLLTMTYDVDMLFYDIEMKMLISWGAFRAYERRTITEVNNEIEPVFVYNMRRKKLINYIKYISNSNKPVRVKENIPYLIYRKKRRKIRRHIKNIKDGNFKKCLRFLEGCKREFKIIIVIGILISIITAIIPSLSGNLVERILSSGIEKVLNVIVIMVILRIIVIILSYFLSKLYLKVKKTMVFNIRKEAFSSVLDFEMNTLNGTSSGSFINKIKDDSNDIAYCFNRIKDIFIMGIGNIGIVIYIFYLNYILGIILIVCMYIIYKIKMKGIVKKLDAKKKILYEQEKYASMISEMISGMKDIKSLDLKDNYMSMTIDKFKMVSDIEFDGDNAENIYNKVSKLFQFATIGIILIVGLFLVDKGMLKASSLVIIYMYKTSVFTSLDRLVVLMNVKLNFNLACTRIFSLLDSSKYKKEEYGSSRLNKCNGEIEFKDVTFGYSNKKILKNCSFKIDKHNTIVIMGPSGVGKTTILNLISRMYKPQAGKVLIDNHDINDLSYDYIKEIISVVSQSPYLFDMSIRDNLKLAKSDLTDKEMKEVCKKVCIDDFIESLPNKYDTVVGEGASFLSQGQKQRIGIARALIKGTPIILLDEITSALDEENTNNIIKLINNIKHNHTIVIVSHDNELSKEFKVYKLENGKIEI